MKETVSDGEKDDRALDRSVLALAREIADTINAGPTEGRDILREMAINAVRDRVQIAIASEPSSLSANGSFNPFAISIPLVFMGAILFFLFPPVGLVMFGTAALMVIWGVVSTLLARS